MLSVSCKCLSIGMFPSLKMSRFALQRSVFLLVYAMLAVIER